MGQTEQDEVRRLFSQKQDEELKRLRAAKEAMDYVKGLTACK